MLNRVLCLLFHYVSVCVCICVYICRSNEEVLAMIRSGDTSSLSLSQATILWEQAPNEKDVRMPRLKDRELLVLGIGR